VQHFGDQDHTHPELSLTERNRMLFVLIILVLLFAAGAVVALARGLLAFSREGDLIRGGKGAYLKRGELQNRMMSQRVLFQALAVLAVTVLGLLFSAH